LFVSLYYQAIFTLEYTLFGANTMSLLSIKPIINYCNINMYTLGNQWIINSGDPTKLYFQIIDISQAVPSNGAVGFGFFYGNPFTGVTGVGPADGSGTATAGTRYLLGVGAGTTPYGVQVTFPSIDSNQVVTVQAVQADPADSSVWYVSLPANQTIGGGCVQFAVTQGSNINRFSVNNVLDVIFPCSIGGC
jgi:hypothetical protein